MSPLDANPVSPPPTHVPRHIVAVSGLVSDPATGNVLLILSPHRGWEFPGGQVEEGESLTVALHREVFEETGVHVTIGPLVGVYTNTRSHIVMFGFRCEWTGGERTTSSESLAVEWVAPDQAITRVTRPPLRDRLRDMIDFDGSVVYRSYDFSALGEAGNEYVIREERKI